MTTDETPPIAGLSDEALQALLRRAIRDTFILGLIATASILEWQRLIRLINARLDRQKAPRGTVTVVLFFVLRLTIFAAAIYGSLKCFQGSAIALLCGLGLAMVAMAWEALRLLKE